MLEKVGGRKAAACITGLAVVVGIYLIKGTLDETVVDAVKFLVTTYLGGNIAGDVVQAFKERSQEPAAPVTDVSDKLQAISEGVNTSNAALQFMISKMPT